MYAGDCVDSTDQYIYDSSCTLAVEDDAELEDWLHTLSLVSGVPIMHTHEGETRVNTRSDDNVSSDATP